MDFLKPGAVRRKDRFQACLEHINTGRLPAKAVTQASLARSLDVEERDLIAYVLEHRVRSSVVTTARRRQLANVLCGVDACEPWLSNGTWTLPDKTIVAPKWLLDAKVEEYSHLFVRLMTLAYCRSRVTEKGSGLLTGPLAQDFMMLTP
jgi:hypothetical protein